MKSSILVLKHINPRVKTEHSNLKSLKALKDEDDVGYP